MHTGSFWYLPEVDLYEKHDDPDSKNEIDILCMLDGDFYAVEVKRTVSSFVNTSGAVDKFLKIVGLLQPDVALLAFQEYCAEDGDVEATKSRLAEAAADIRARIGSYTKLKTLVAQESQGFNEFSADLGWFDRRMRNYH